MRSALALLVVAACRSQAEPTIVPPAATVPMSDPFEYAIDHVSRDAGEAIFTKTGIGDPYRTGMPYPLFLALFKMFPQQLGRDWDELADRFGFVKREPDPASSDPDLREGLPIGMHLTVDPITGVPFVVTSCVLCHAEKVRWSGGEATVIGLANKRVRIHAYDAAFTEIGTAHASAATLARYAATAAEAHHIKWPDAYAQPIVAATVAAMAKRAAARTDLVARTHNGAAGRIAVIDMFVGVLGELSHKSVQFSPTIGWSKVPDVIGFPVRTTLSWDGSAEGSMDVLAVEADVAAGVRIEWLNAHPMQGASLGAYLRQPAPRPPFPHPIDRALADRGKKLFEDQCAHCHGHYGPDGRVIAYVEQVIPLEDIGTDPGRAMAATASFELAANDRDITHGYTKFRRTGGYVPPVLTNVWMRAPYGHAGQWASLAVIATPPARRQTLTMDLEGLYDLDEVGVATATTPPKDEDQTHDDPAMLAGHPFLADLGADAPAVIEYLKTL
jgi:hypothetical protein